ncbi:hypothetical protein D9758_006864 [Tetrapyrgos nigripes]|uniref:Uncharacterized protein n=1 Tax=Tetrapyrgos nigripes TaxID=182062 RepID=A0A8H5CVF8_9AGAR|nr:hypothetical protein D9758_006864 [Tetrapyrgos nigripes]
MVSERVSAERPLSPFSQFRSKRKLHSASGNEFNATTINGVPTSTKSPTTTLAKTTTTKTTSTPTKAEADWAPSSWGVTDSDPFAAPEPGAALADVSGLDKSTLSVASTFAGLSVVEEFHQDAYGSRSRSRNRTRSRTRSGTRSGHGHYDEYGSPGHGHETEYPGSPELGSGNTTRMSAWGRLQLPVPSSASVGLLSGGGDEQVGSIRRSGGKGSQRQECSSWVDVTKLEEEEEQDEVVVQEGLIAQRLLKKLNREGRGKGRGKARVQAMVSRGRSGSGGRQKNGAGRLGGTEEMRPSSSTQTLGSGISWGAARSFLLMNSLARERERLTRDTSTSGNKQSFAPSNLRPIVGERL